jgi:dihydropyrimidinase
MSKVIKGGTIITADRSYTADVKIDGDIISEIGENLAGDEIVDASSCFVMPGGIDPSHSLRNAIHGYNNSGDMGKRHICSSLWRNNNYY